MVAKPGSMPKMRMALPFQFIFCISIANLQAMRNQKKERSLLPFVLMAETPAFLTSSLFLDIERSTKILYDIKKLELSAVLFVYIDKEQLYKLEFLGVRSQG